MTSVDWEEVKRLAADFQKAQLTSTLQKYETFATIWINLIYSDNKVND